MKRLVMVLVVLCLPFPVLFSLLSCAQAAPAASVELRVASGLPPTDPVAKSFVQFEEEVTKATNGRITWKNFWMASLVKAMEELKSVGGGLCDVAGIWINYYPSQLPLNNYPYGMPFNVSDPVLMNKLAWQMMKELPEVGKEPEKFKTKILTMWAIGSYELTTKKPLNSLEDLKGLKLAISGFYLPKWFEAVGATATQIPGPERYSSLQTGVIDGQVMGIVQTNSIRLQEVSPHVTLVGLGCAYGFWGINLDSWSRLSADDQEIMRQAASRQEQRIAAITLDNTRLTLDAWRKQGATVLEFSQAEKAKWAGKISAGPWAYAKHTDALGLPGTKLVDTYLKLCKDNGYQFPMTWVKP